MARLAIENVLLTEDFGQMWEQLGVRLPLDLDGRLVVDDRGAPIADLNPTGDRQPDTVRAIGMMILLAVNTCGGFRAVREQ